MTSSPRIALTPGAENGVGPELLIKALACFSPLDTCTFFWCGDRASLTLACTRSALPLTIHGSCATLANGLTLQFFPDLSQGDQLMRQAQFLDRSVDLAKRQSIDAIVTGPIEKSALSYVQGGPFPGQTEFFATHLGTEEKPFMAFMGGPFIMSLLTTHIPLRQVADAITEELLFGHLQTVASSVARLRSMRPQDINITVLGLNPHAGEHGLIGDEEQNTFIPAIKKAQSLGLAVHGPVPADGFFAYYQKLPTLPDVVVSPYHDQGLGAYKAIAAGRAANVTLGLSHVRTSPAHGIAADLVGTQSASMESTLSAIGIAVDLVKGRRA